MGASRARRDELLEIGRKPGLSTLPQGVNMSVIRCVRSMIMLLISPARAARASNSKCSACDSDEGRMLMLYHWAFQHRRTWDAAGNWMSSHSLTPVPSRTGPRRRALGSGAWTS